MLYFKTLKYLGHVLKEHISWNFIIRICSEAVLEIVHVEPEADQPPDGLPGHARAGPGLLQLTPRGKNTLEFQTRLKSDQGHTQYTI